MHKRLVAGLSGLVTCLQSNFIGTNFVGFCSNLGVSGLFSSPFVSYWAHIDWLAPGYLMGRGIPPFMGNETQVPAACQPQPRQPHNKQHKEPDHIKALIGTEPFRGEQALLENIKILF